MYLADIDLVRSFRNKDLGQESVFLIDEVDGCFVSFDVSYALASSDLVSDLFGPFKNFSLTITFDL
jgi:hypothetical protein